ncbi:TniB family NTP-binding protein [Lysobacter auxotrophicus]|uniref:TniB family NTP-binding protein n=1 Tax=Lysobacter auxotrophicus TaxID=2992573 RepID=A0ABM8DDM4_9GAMM|nr:TniB family NTP-binding protein [Lysobacter auxotrophicus]BDU16628.1 TniB family NTP-binding protein [Lysobacter auxotrophicus]
MQLTAPARAMLLGSVSERSAFVSTQAYIPTTEGVAALQWLSYLRRHAYGVDRPRNQHVVAPPGTGKSRLLSHYASQFEPVRDQFGVLKREVALAEAPEDGDLRHMRSRIATACMPGLNENGSYSTEDVIELLLAASVRQLLLDEMGNILNGSRLSQQKILALIKGVTNRGITVGIATTDRLRLVLAADEQLKDRFHMTTLRHWQESEGLRSFLDAVELQLPLPNPSKLSSPAIVRCFLRRERNSTSGILDPIRDACRIAFQEDLPNLTLDLIEDAIESPFPPGGGLVEGRSRHVDAIKAARRSPSPA